MDSLKKTLSSLRGHRKRYEHRFEDDLKNSDTGRTEKLKTFVLEQNDKVIAQLEKMLDAIENDQDQAYAIAQMDGAENIERKIKETFVTYCQKIQENTKNRVLMLIFGAFFLSIFVLLYLLMF